MSDPRVEQIKLALSGEQSGAGLDDIRVYMGPSRQVGQGFGGIMKSIYRMVAPVVLRIGKTLFKTSSEALKNGDSIGDSFKSALKPTLRTALKHGGKALGKIIEQQEAPPAAPPLEPPLLHQDERDVGTEKPQVGSGRYKTTRKRKVHGSLIRGKKANIHYNF
jgi:hypothetical protein